MVRSTTLRAVLVALAVAGAGGAAVALRPGGPGPDHPHGPDAARRAVPVSAAAATPTPTGRLPKLGMPPAVIKEYRQAHPYVPVATLYERLALTAPRKRLLARWATGHAKTFGGSWYDYDAGVWHLWSTDATVLAKMAAQARAAGVAVAPRVVAYSAEELQARAHRIVAGKDPLSRYSTKAGVDVLGNRVQLAVVEPPAGVRDPMVEFIQAHEG